MFLINTGRKDRLPLETGLELSVFSAVKNCDLIEKLRTREL